MALFNPAAPAPSGQVRGLAIIGLILLPATRRSDRPSTFPLAVCTTKAILDGYATIGRPHWIVPTRRGAAVP
jgi:hypothetical protein